MTTQVTPKNLHPRRCDRPDGCGRAFMGGPRAWYCPICQKERRKIASRKYKARRRLGENRPLGSTDTCTVCGGDYEVRGPHQRYCPACAPEAIRKVDAQQGLEYYAKHKDKINPPRKLARRKGPRPCIVCGNMFDALHDAKLCSEACRAIRKKERQHRADKKRRSKPPLTA